MSPAPCQVLAHTEAVLALKMLFMCRNHDLNQSSVGQEEREGHPGFGQTNRMGKEFQYGEEARELKATSRYVQSLQCVDQPYGQA